MLDVCLKEQVLNDRSNKQAARQNHVSTCSCLFCTAGAIVEELSWASAPSTFRSFLITLLLPQILLLDQRPFVCIHHYQILYTP